MASLLALAVLGLGIALAGCASGIRYPCRIEGISLLVLATTEQVGAHCRDVLGSCPDRGCGARDRRNRPTGCVDIAKKQIVGTQHRTDWEHEIGHLIEKHCHEPES